MLVHVKSLLLFGFVVNVLLHQLYKTFSPGNGRFARLMQSVQQGNVQPPVDLRYLKKEEGKQTARSPHLDSVLSFLEGIYIAVAEHLPDVRDVLPGVGTEADEGDPHGHDLDDQSKAPKAKRMKRGVKIADGRTVQDGCQQRWLPPGSMKEYWVQYRQQGGDNLASFPTFWRAWTSHYSFLRFRAGNQHAQCHLPQSWQTQSQTLVLHDCLLSFCFWVRG